MNEITIEERRSVVECALLCAETEDCRSVFGCKLEGEIICTLFNQSYVYEMEFNSSTCKHYTKHRVKHEDVGVEESNNLQKDQITTTPAAELTTTTHTSCENQVNPLVVNKGNASFGCRDCDCIFAKTQVSGEYIIHLEDSLVRVYCEFRNGRSWTVIQRRMNGSVSFKRNWKEYSEGFGCLETDFWIGNDFIHGLTKNGHVRLIIDLEDDNGVHYYAHYSDFAIGDETEKYKLSVKGFSGNIFDAFGSVCDTYCHNDMRFSTYDQDNDGSARKSCAENHNGWWFNDCYRCVLNDERIGWWAPDTGLLIFKSVKMALTKPL
ncbi:fibrinogen-like protein A [Saccostrea cucullata]|uniref:fibrinogen-like protein A n=1 Tax=Saccostrea cuccullata TaxID=36930 RepID=UPI002ED0A558